MALATTTLSAAAAAGDNQITVASATSVAAGRLIRVDDEYMQVSTAYVSGSTTVPVIRGLQGSAVVAHVSGANAVHGLTSDFDDAPAQSGASVISAALRTRRVVSYGASGAIAHPNAGEDVVAILNGTSNLTMTVAAPTKDIDGCILFIMGGGKTASTITFASGIGNAGSSYDVATLQNAGDVGISVMAVNGFWVLLNGPITGTSTALSFAIA